MLSQILIIQFKPSELHSKLGTDIYDIEEGIFLILVRAILECGSVFFRGIRWNLGPRPFAGH